jgi:signal transduction histidine kinase
MTGVVIVHPYVMLVHKLTGPGHGGVTSGGSVVVNIAAAFTPAMLPMTIAFGFFGGVCGLLLSLLFERNQRIVRFQYKAQLHRDLMNALHQLLGVLSHYILNSSMMISGYARRLRKNAQDADLQILSAIILQVEKNEAILKVIQEAEFLRNIDPSDNTYQKLVDLNRRIEEQLD